MYSKCMRLSLSSALARAPAIGDTRQQTACKLNPNRSRSQQHAYIGVFPDGMTRLKAAAPKDL